MIVIDLAVLRDWRLIRLPAMMDPDPNNGAQWCFALGQERQLFMLDKWILSPGCA
jgi:hypothetical protein